MFSALSGIGYAGMSVLSLMMWILVATACGAGARLLVRGAAPFGLFGDMLIGLTAIFALGSALRSLGVDVSKHVLLAAPSVPRDVAIWLDIALVGLVGALILRLVIKLITKR